MVFHVPSFLLGYAAGLATGLVLPRLRPVAVEVMASIHRFADDVASRVATVRETLEDVVAEARERARRRPAPAPDAANVPHATA